MLTGVDRGTVTVTATSEGQSASVTRVIVIKYRSIAAGTMHACDIASGGIVWCWAMSTTPTRVSETLSFSKIALGAAFTCGLTTDGATYCWGANSIGQLGDGKPISYGNVYIATPNQVVGGHTFQSISLGSQYTCAVTTLGQGFCWGSNNTKFGAGNTGDSSSPVLMGAG